MRYILVINSRNNKTNNKKFEDAVLRIFQENSELRSRMELKYTEYPGHAYDVAMEASVKYKGSGAVVTVGGDGTIHEVANALAFRQTPLIAIPFGTGNDFVKTVHPSWKKWSFSVTIPSTTVDRSSVFMSGFIFAPLAENCPCRC